MLVVADSSPLNILVRIGHIGVIEPLFGRVLIPPAVAAELQHANTPPIVRDWFRSSPAWLEVRSPSVPAEGVGRGQGEQEAIRLALELHADLILVDDRQARQRAVSTGLAITGTLGVLIRADLEGLLDLPDAISRLRGTDFFVTQDLIERAMRRVRADNRPGGYED